MNEFEFEIPNFTKYNPRKDVVSTNWLRLSNTTFYDNKFAMVGSFAKLLWFFFMSEYSRASAKPVSTSCQLIARVVSIRCSQVRSAVDELERNQMLVILRRDVDVAYERTKRTNETNVSHAPALRVKPARKSSSSTQDVEKKALQTELNSAKTISPQTNQTELAIQTESKINLLGHYIDTWRSKYGTQMPRKNSDGAILKRIAQANGHEQTIKMITAYFAMPDAWAVKKAHDLFTFERMLAEIVRFMNTGHVVTNSAAKEVDETVHHRQKNQAGEDEFKATVQRIENEKRRMNALLEGKTSE